MKAFIRHKGVAPTTVSSPAIQMAKGTLLRLVVAILIMAACDGDSGQGAVDLAYFADVTGDGKADAIVVNDSTVTVRRSDGTQFTANENWTHGAYFGTRGTYFADVTGDGKADAIVVS